MSVSKLRPALASQFAAEAKRVQQQTLRHMWLEESGYFALGIDYDDSGNVRAIKTRTANPAGLLMTKFFDDLPDAKKQQYVGAIVRTIMSPDFLTDAGIRSRSLATGNLSKFWSYHGSHVTWPKETIDIVAGLKRQGFHALTYQLAARLLNGVTRYGSYPEFIYVDENGNMLTDVRYTKTHEDIMVVESTNKPESLQAWTITAVMVALDMLYGSEASKSNHKGWQATFEWEVLDKMPIIGHIHRREDLLQLYPELHGTITEPKAKKTSFYPKRIREAIAS